jgi:type II secretory pathway component GspD/PulD (secretin)
MKMNCDALNYEGRGSRSMKFACGILGVALALVSIGPGAWGQTPDSNATEKVRQEVSNPRIDSRPFQTFYLSNATQVNDANEMTVAIRNLLPPDVKVYLVPSQNALTVRGTPDELALVQKIIGDLDRPRKAYRLTFTTTETDGSKRIGVQHFAMIVTPGQRTVLKQGSKVPIATGSYNTTGNTAQTQFTYLDVGMNFDATLDEVANGARLRSKVEQLSIAEQTSGVGLQDPIIRQSALEGTSFLTLGKPLVLGSIDIPGSTRHLDVEVVMELIGR